MKSTTNGESDNCLCCYEPGIQACETPRPNITIQSITVVDLINNISIEIIEIIDFN